MVVVAEQIELSEVESVISGFESVFTVWDSVLYLNISLFTSIEKLPMDRAKKARYLCVSPDVSYTIYQKYSTVAII